MTLQLERCTLYEDVDRKVSIILEQGMEIDKEDISTHLYIRTSDGSSTICDYKCYKVPPSIKYDQEKGYREYHIQLWNKYKKEYSLSGVLDVMRKKIGIPDRPILSLEINAESNMQISLLNEVPSLYLPDTKTIIQHDPIQMRNGLYYVSIKESTGKYRIVPSDRGFPLYIPIDSSQRYSCIRDIFIHLFSHMLYYKFKGYSDILIVTGK